MYKCSRGVCRKINAVSTPWNLFFYFINSKVPVWLERPSYMEQMHWTFWTSSVLLLCPVAKYTLAKSRWDDLLSLSASHIRVMPDVRFDGAGHIWMKRKELRIWGHEWCKGNPRSFLTKCNKTLCIQFLILYHNKWNFELLTSSIKKYTIRSWP